MTTELVLATNIVKAALGLVAVLWTLLLIRLLRDNRRALFWLLVGSTEILGAVALSALWFGFQRLTVLGYLHGAPDAWRDSTMAAVCNIIYAHGSWIVILVSYRVWVSKYRTVNAASMDDMPRYAGRSLVAILLLVAAIGMLLGLV